MILVNNPLSVNIYLFNQIIDVTLWAWISLIMFKRVLCKDYHTNFCLLKDIIRKYCFNSIPNKTIKKIIINQYFIADGLLLAAALIAVIQFSNQFYFHVTNIDDKILQRTWIWMIFHKVLTASILVRYRKYQPKIFSEIKIEIKHFLNNLIYNKTSN